MNIFLNISSFHQIQASRIGTLVNQTAIADALDDVFKTGSAQISEDDFLDAFVNVDVLLALLNKTNAGTHLLYYNFSGSPFFLK